MMTRPDAPADAYRRGVREAVAAPMSAAASVMVSLIASLDEPSHDLSPRKLV